MNTCSIGLIRENMRLGIKSVYPVCHHSLLSWLTYIPAQLGHLLAYHPECRSSTFLALTVISAVEALSTTCHDGRYSEGWGCVYKHVHSYELIAFVGKD